MSRQFTCRLGIHLLSNYREDRVTPQSPNPQSISRAQIVFWHPRRKERMAHLYSTGCHQTSQLNSSLTCSEHRSDKASSSHAHALSHKFTLQLFIKKADSSRPYKWNGSHSLDNGQKDKLFRCLFYGNVAYKVTWDSIHEIHHSGTPNYSFSENERDGHGVPAYDDGLIRNYRGAPSKIQISQFVKCPKQTLTITGQVTTDSGCRE